MLQNRVWYIRAALRSNSNFERLAGKHSWQALARNLEPELLRDNVSQPANLEHWLCQHSHAWDSLKPSELDIPAAVHEILWTKTDK